MKYLLILIYCLSSIYSFSQINKKDLYGNWYSTNNQNYFNESDTVFFYRNKEFFKDKDSCSLIHWKFDTKGIHINYISNCKHDNYWQIPVWFAKYNFKNTDFGQVLTVKYKIRGGQIFSKNKIIVHKNNEYLQLIRFDDLSEQKLNNHVDSLVHHVLKYDSTKVDSLIQNLLNPNDEYGTIKIVDGFDNDRKPLLLINGVIQEDYEILKHIRMVEVISIDYISENTKAAELCGFRGINGVILLQISPKRYKQALKQQTE